MERWSRFGVSGVHREMEAEGHECEPQRRQNNSHILEVEGKRLMEETKGDEGRGIFREDEAIGHVV